MKAKVEIHPELKAFLVKNRCVRKFIHNARNHFCTGKCYEGERKLLGESFTFKATPEGHSYWWELHLKYDFQQP